MRKCSMIAPVCQHPSRECRSCKSISPSIVTSPRNHFFSKWRDLSASGQSFTSVRTAKSNVEYEGGLLKKGRRRTAPQGNFDWIYTPNLFLVSFESVEHQVIQGMRLVCFIGNKVFGGQDVGIRAVNKFHRAICENNVPSLARIMWHCACARNKAFAI